MKPEDRGNENAETIRSRTPGQLPQDSAGAPTQGERAGGTHEDVPGGAYNVPEDLTEQVSEEPARDRRQEGDA